MPKSIVSTPNKPLAIPSAHSSKQKKMKNHRDWLAIPNTRGVGPEGNNIKRRNAYIITSRGRRRKHGSMKSRVELAERRNRGETEEAKSVLMPTNARGIANLTLSQSRRRSPDLICAVSIVSRAGQCLSVILVSYVARQRKVLRTVTAHG